MKRIIVLAFAMILAFTANDAAATGFSFESVSFPSDFTSQIMNIAVTQRGQLWVGTNDGLFRMDHNNYFRYAADGKPGSIPGNTIWSLNVDKNDILWVRTDNGVAIYDPDNDSFRTLQAEIDGVMKNIVVYSELAVENGLLLGGDNVIYYFDETTDKITVRKELNIIPSFSAHEIIKMPNGHISLFDKKNGFAEYVPETNSLEECPVGSPALGNRCFYIDSEANFWRSVFNKGLECYNPAGELIGSFTKENSDLNCNVINCILERDGMIWVGTELGGINIINPKTREVLICKKEDDNPNSFPCNSVRSMFCDKDGNVWVVRGKGGIELLRYTYCRSFYVSPAAENSGSVSLSVSSLLSDYYSNNLFIGTSSNGIYSIEKKGNQINYKNIVSFPKTKGFCIESMALLPDHRILVAVFAEGLYILNPSDGSFRPIDRPDSRIEDYIRNNGTGRRTTVCNDSKGNTLIFTNNVFLFESGRSKFSYIDYNVNMTDGPMYRVNGKDSDLFHERRSIFSWNPDNKTFSSVLDLGEDIINGAAIDNSGQLWLATDKGLCWVSRDLKSREFIETPLFHKANSVLCDEIGRVFIGAEGKMHAYLPASREFKSLGMAEGIRTNNYDSGAVSSYFSEITDRLFFGGTEGVVFIDTDMDIILNKTPHIGLASLFVDEQRITDFSNIVLPLNYRDLRIKVVCSDDDILSSKTFSFKITGPQNRCDIAESTAGSISLRYKTAGKYHVQTACLLDNGEWSDYQDIASFTVVSPWFRSLWFVLLCFVLFCTILFFIARFSKK